MKVITQNSLAYLSLLSLLALLKPITGDSHWTVFLVFLSFMVFTKVKADERLKSNLNKAARNGFLASIICIVGLAFVINTQPAPDMLIIALEASFWIMVIVFAASFTLFDRMGIS